MENSANSISAFDRYFSGLLKFGINEESVNLLKEKYGDKLKKASICTKRDSGCAYEGSLLDVILKASTVACNLNSILSKDVRLDNKVLCKVCFLNMIGMAEVLVPQPDKWRNEHLGEMFMYKEGLPAIGNCLCSVSMCSQCGISLTPEEIEAMTIIDRPADDKQSKFYSSMLSVIVKSAYEITFAELRTMAKMQGGTKNV